MTFVPPMLLMRMKKIVYLLERTNAFSEESAKKITEIGLRNPGFFPGAVKLLVAKGIISRTCDGKYYINQ